MTIVRWAMRLAPIAVFGLMAQLTTQIGLAALLGMAYYVATVMLGLLLMAWLVPGFFCLGVLFGNVHAQAMEPLGHIAGIGAAVVGALSMLLSVPLGAAIGQLYDGTVLPLAGGFALLATASALVMAWAGRDLAAADDAVRGHGG